MAAQPGTIQLLPPTSQIHGSLTIADTRKILSMKEIEDLWTYFRVWDNGTLFGNFPAIGNIGLWAINRKYRDEYDHILRPIFVQLTQFQNGQLIFISNDMSDTSLVIDKNGSTFKVSSAILGGDDIQQTAWDQLFIAANDLRFFGRIILALIVSY